MREALGSIPAPKKKKTKKKKQHDLLHIGTSVGYCTQDEHRRAPHTRGAFGDFFIF
jgi:hypothetical protein